MKTRHYNAVLHIEVPITSEEDSIKTSEQLNNYITSIFSDKDITVKCDVNKISLPAEFKEPFGHGQEDITSFLNPVGYIAPGGIFYGMEEKDDTLAHIALSYELYEYYKDKVGNFEYSPLGIDFVVENMGFIKIHNRTVMYSFRPKYPKYWTDAQKETVYQYMKEMERRHRQTSEFDVATVKFEGAGVNSGWKHSSVFRNMDDLSIIRCFHCM